MESRHWGAAGPGEESEMKGCSLALEGGREQGGRDPMSGSSEGASARALGPGRIC